MLKLFFFFWIIRIKDWHEAGLKKQTNKSFIFSVLIFSIKMTKRLASLGPGRPGHVVYTRHCRGAYAGSCMDMPGQYQC